MSQSPEDINHLIAQKIGITIEDLQTTLSIIIRICEIEPDLLEVVKVWRIQQISPLLCDWWEILVFNPIVDENNECYLLYEISDWGEDSPDSVYFLEGDSRPTQTVFQLDNCTVELLFENDTHD